MLPGTNVAYAAGPSDAIVVIVQLYGGNDGLNTCYPLTGSQRTEYENLRPSLGLPATVGDLAPWIDSPFFDVSSVLSIGTNSNGTEYALHPAMTSLHSLYGQGKVAVVPGVHYPHPNHSHFRSEEIWYTADPLAPGGPGWLGSYLTLAGFGSTDVPGVVIGNELNPLFTPSNASIFSFRNLSALSFPAIGDTEAMQARALALFTESAGVDPVLYPELSDLGGTATATLQKIDEYYQPGNGLEDAGKVEALLLNEEGRYRSSNYLAYDSPLNFDGIGGRNDRLVRDARHVAATIRADVGARFFHVGIGGFDTHSSQEKDLYHSFLLQAVSDTITALYGEMNQEVILPVGYTGYRTENLASRLLIVTLSEFGRTRHQNSENPQNAGTDHAASSVHFAIGDPVIGGQYGDYPLVDDPRPNDEGDLRLIWDFRDFYGTILNSWLNVSLPDLGPGDGKLLPETSVPDEDGNSYTSFMNIGFIS
jgi:uncharacterized protein (DUF1501 family)